MKKILFCSSICTGGYGHIKETISWLESKEIDRIHIDIMDGQFVRPIMGGVDYVNMIRENTSLSIELHFMTYDVEKFLEMYNIRENEIVYIHPNTTYHPHRVLQSIHARKAKPGIVISVDDEPEDFVELYEECEFAMLMGVVPGCPGSEFHKSVFRKIKQLREICKEQGLARHVEIDGSVSPQNIEKLIEAGFDSVVLGYPGCFDPVNGREKTINTMIRLAR